MRKLKNYKIPGKATDKHKIVWDLLWLISFIILFPFAIIQILNIVFEVILEFGIKMRTKIVYTIFKLLYIKECRYDEEDDE